MSFIKQLFSRELKFTPASYEVNWTKIETLVHGPGAGEDDRDTNSAVFACLMAIASAYPEPPLCVVRKDREGNNRKLDDHPLQVLLDNPTPNNELSIDEIHFWTAWALHVDGNAYWLKVRSGNADTGNVIQLWPISPTVIEPVSERGEWVSYYKYRVEPNRVVGIPVSNIIHFRNGLDDEDMRKGLSPLKHLARQISTDNEADKFVDALLKNYAIPGLVVIPQNGVTVPDESDADRISNRMARKFGNDNRGKIAVMNKEVKVEQFGFSPKDLDMSILHRIPEERISAVMGVPAIVAGLGAGLDRATYANFKEAREMFTEQKLVPMWRTNARKVQANLLSDFGRGRNIFVEFDLTDVRTLQEDEDAKYKRLQIAVGNKPFMEINEARSDIGLDPIEGGNNLTEVPKPAPPPPPVQEQAPNPNGSQPQEEQEQPPKAVDLEKWQRKALKALKSGGNVGADFASEHIPEDEHAAIVEALGKAETVEDVKAVFDAHIRAAQPWTVIERLIFEMDRANGLLEATYQPGSNGNKG